ncbi:hypothetical protein ACKI1S_42635 [Streptomyces galilaeus]|uniref:Uncharacterized protein n=1 Tax=Streptomyces galilaeus TaxID=33899 RepID=A0ABW9IWF5_STRGJ
MNVDSVIAEKIAAARARAEAAKRRRAAFTAARQRGLAHRHAAKLRNQDSAHTADGSAEDNPSPANDIDDVVTEVTEAEWHDGARAALAQLGLTYAELEDQARRRDFTSAQAHSLWTSIGNTVNPELLEENS